MFLLRWLGFGIRTKRIFFMGCELCNYGNNEHNKHRITRYCRYGCPVDL